jgi:hypothetical protein
VAWITAFIHFLENEFKELATKSYLLADGGTLPLTLSEAGE